MGGTVQGSRILMLDDDRETRWALATVLRREGAQVVEAANGEEGLRQLMRQPFDLCVSDVCMPGLGGFGVYAALRYGDAPELDAARRTPMMLLSGQVPPRELAQAMEAGVDDFLQKPVDPEVFKARVRSILRRSRVVAPPKGQTHGDLADFGAPVLVHALHVAARTVRLSIQSGQVSALLDFHRGQIVHAHVDEISDEYRGEDAVLRALTLVEGRFEVLPPPESSPRSVFENTEVLLARAAAPVAGEAP